MEGCIGKLHVERYNDRKICRKLPVNETVENLVASTYFSLDCLELKTNRMLNNLLHIESAVRFKHNMQVMMEYIARKVKKVDDGEIKIIPFVIKLSCIFRH
jgi:hypothetical protein